MPKRKKRREFWVVNIGGDRSYVSAHRSSDCVEGKIEPPPGKHIRVFIPGSADWILIADMDTLKNPKWIKKTIQKHLYQEYGEQVLDYAGVKWCDDDHKWNWFEPPTDAEYWG